MKLLEGSSEISQESLIQRERQEHLVNASAAGEILSKLNVSVESLPQKCQQLLHQLATAKAASEISELDPAAICLQQFRETAQMLDDDYEILKLRQKNDELQAKIDRNNAFLEQLRKDLEYSRESLKKKNPNPDNIQEYCRQMKQKVVSYEESFERARNNFTKLSVPEQAMPKSLSTLASNLAELKEEATKLRQHAEDIQLARQARDTLMKLRR